MLTQIHINCFLFKEGTYIGAPFSDPWVEERIINSRSILSSYTHAYKLDKDRRRVGWVLIDRKEYAA